MSSPTSARKWLLSTCRGRVAHLRKHLPTWLERLPSWDPVVVCCDDKEAFEYVAGELMLAERGICLFVEQGQYFNRLEAIRAGIGVIQSGVVPCGQAFTASVCAPNDLTDNDLVAMWDADAVALRGTERGLADLTTDDVAIAASKLRQEMGFFVASLHLLRLGLADIPVGMFESYGHEDCALRLAVWSHYKRPFVCVPLCWSRATHPDKMRHQFYRDGMMRRSGTLNGQRLGELLARLAPGNYAQWRAHCYWPGTYVERPVTRAG